MTRAAWRGGTLLALALFVAGCALDENTRVPNELQKIESPALKPRVLWDASPGASSDALVTRLRVAVQDDLLISADIDGDVFALDRASGKVRWTAETDARAIAGPTIAGDLVLLGTLGAEVIALNRTDGAPVWRVPVSSEVLAPPVSDGSVVIVRCGDGKLFALAADTGARLWSFDRAQPQLTLRGQSAPLLFEGVLVAGLDNGRAVALRTDTGEVLWEQVVAAPTGRNDLDRIVDIDGDLVTVGGGVYAVSFGGEVAAVALEDGRVAWRRPIKSYSGVTLNGTQLIVTDEEGLVWALDAQSGAAAWKQEALKYRKPSPAAVVGEHIVVADFEGYLHWLSPRDGSIVGRVRAVDGAVASGLTARGATLYVLDAEGNIAAVEAQAVN